MKALNIDCTFCRQSIVDTLYAYLPGGNRAGEQANKKDTHEQKLTCTSLTICHRGREVTYRAQKLRLSPQFSIKNSNPKRCFQNNTLTQMQDILAYSISSLCSYSLSTSHDGLDNLITNIIVFVEMDQEEMKDFILQSLSSASHRCFLCVPFSSVYFHKFSLFLVF